MAPPEGIAEGGEQDNLLSRWPHFPVGFLSTIMPLHNSQSPFIALTNLKPVHPMLSSSVPSDNWRPPSLVSFKYPHLGHQIFSSLGGGYGSDTSDLG